MQNFCKCLRAVGAVALAVAISNSPLFAGTKSSSTRNNDPQASCPSVASNPKDKTVCVNTQGDSTTPLRLPDPVRLPDGKSVTVEVGPLSPIESCSLGSITTTPSTATTQGALAQLIAVLMGNSIAPLAVPAGPSPSGNITAQGITESFQGENSELGRLLKEIKGYETTATKEINEWISRRAKAVAYLGQHQDLLTIDERASRASTASEGPAEQIARLARVLSAATQDCLQENCTANPDPAAAQDQPLSKTDLEQTLAEAKVDVKSAAALVKGSQELDQEEAELAALQNANTALRASDATLQTVSAQVEKISLHINSRSGPGSDTPSYHEAPLNGALSLFESLRLQPNEDSDTTASVTCTSVLDNSTTLGPVPITIKTRKWHPVFSVGALLSLTPHQTLGIVPQAGSSTSVSSTGTCMNPSASSGSSSTATACTNYLAANTGLDHFQVIPFAFLTVFHPAVGPIRFGITGGVGFNPYSGVQGIDGFEGLGFQWKREKIYLQVGIHDGRYEDLDPNSNIILNQPLPQGFPTTSALPTRTRFTFHPAFGLSYSF